MLVGLKHVIAKRQKFVSECWKLGTLTFLILTICLPEWFISLVTYILFVLLKTWWTLWILSLLLKKGQSKSLCWKKRSASSFTTLVARDHLDPHNSSWITGREHDWVFLGISGFLILFAYFFVFQTFSVWWKPLLRYESH